MRFRRGALLLSLIALGTSVWWVVDSRSPSIERHLVAPGAEAPGESKTPPAPAAGASPLEPTRQEAPPTDGAQAQSPEPSDPFLLRLRGPEKGILVEGTVTVVDAEDREHAAEDGEFVPLALLDGSGGGGRKVPVRAGRFRMRFPPGRELCVDSLVLGGRPAHVPEDPGRSAAGVSNAPRNRFTIVEGQPVHVLARWPRPVLLHVVDAQSLRELEDVSVFLARSGWWTAQAKHPGAVDAAETLVERGDSPLELQGPRVGSNLQWRDFVWAHAAGRTWGRTPVDFVTGAETTVELAAGADLDVTLVGEIPPAPRSQKISFDADETIAVLRLRPRDLLQLVLEAPPRIPGPTRFEGLPAGSFDLSLERGRFYDRPQVLGRTQVELVAGATTQATITIEPPQEPRRVRLAGTLLLSPDWDCKWLDLRFEPVDVPGGTSLEERGLEMKDLKPVAESPGVYRFELAPVLPGRYLVNSYVFSWQQVVETGDAGRDDVVIAIGDPADVLVHLLDAATDLPVHEEKLLLWNCRWPEETTGGGLKSARWDAERQAWSFRAPAGGIELRVAYESRRFELVAPNPYVTVHPGFNELTLRVQRASGVLLHFEVDGRRIGWPSDAGLLHVEPPEGEAIRMAVRSVQDEGVFVPTPSAGRWRLLLPSLKGYEPVAPIDLTAEPRTVRHVAIPLRRRN